MPKALSMSGMVVAILMVLLFLGDLLASLAGIGFPFGGASKTMDICMAVAAGILGYMSWSAYREEG
jgi:hypothetical protein